MQDPQDRPASLETHKTAASQRSQLSCEGRQPHKLSCSWPSHFCSHFRSAAGHLSCSCPVEPFAPVDVLHGGCLTGVLQLSFPQDSPATVGHAATRTRRRAAGQSAIHIMPSAERQTEMEDMTQTQATAHAQPIRRTSPTSGVTSRRHGILSPNSENKNKSKNNCLCVAFIVSVGGLQERRQLGVVEVGLLFLFSWPSNTKENMT